MNTTKHTLLALLIASSLGMAHAAQVTEVARIVAVVNKGVITSQDLQQRILEVQKNLKAQNIPSPAADILTRQVLDQMINEQVQLDYAANNNITVDETDIDQAIGRLASQNKLTVDGLKERLAREGTEFAAFRKDIRRELLLARLKESEIESRVSVSDTEIEQALKTAGSDEEFRLASILVEVPERASGKDLETLKRKAEKALAELDAGQGFGKVAATYSNAPNALKGGELGWRPASALPPEFVSMLKALKNGQHTGIIPTQQGFYIFQLEDRRSGKQADVVEQFHARHILIKTNEAVSEQDARARILQIRDRILRGAKFADMARLYSEDASNASGGDLGWMGLGQTVPEFEKAMTTLPFNTLSEPVRTPFGWHLLLVEGKRNQDVSSERLRNQVRQQIRQRKVDQSAIDWLRQLRDAAFVEEHLEDK